MHFPPDNPCILKEILQREKKVGENPHFLLWKLWGQMSPRIWNSEYTKVMGIYYVTSPAQPVIKHMKILINRDVISLKSVQFSSNFATKCICAKSPKTNKSLFFFREF